MDKIRAELDRVGNNMTMIGSHTPPIGATMVSPPQEATPEDVLRMGRAYRRMAALHKASQVMASNFDLNERLAKVLDIVMEVMGADRGFVMLREEATHNLNVKVAREMGKELVASSPSMGIAGRAAIDGEPVLMADRSTDHEFGMRDSIIMSQIVSAMCVPLKIEIGFSAPFTWTRANRPLPSMKRTWNSSLRSPHSPRWRSITSNSTSKWSKRKSAAEFWTIPPARPRRKDSFRQRGNRARSQKTQVSTMFCDIRGSTQLGEQLSRKNWSNC